MLTCQKSTLHAGFRPPDFWKKVEEEEAAGQKKSETMETESQDIYICIL